MPRHTYRKCFHCNHSYFVAISLDDPHRNDHLIRLEPRKTRDGLWIIVSGQPGGHNTAVALAGPDDPVGRYKQHRCRAAKHLR